MNSLLEYKGYHASIKFDADDEIFIGEVFGISDSLNFHGQSVTEIKKMFHQSIDNYLELCKEIGKDPDKEFKGVFNIRISPENHKKAALEAKKRGIKLNQFISEAIEHELNRNLESNKEFSFSIPLKINDISPKNIQNDIFNNYEDFSILKKEETFEMEDTHYNGKYI